MSLPETASFADFARIGRFKPSYVTQLRHDGRLVLTDDGKAVKVRESLERIQATRDPSKAGGVARHEAERGTAVVTAQPEKYSETIPPPESDEAEDTQPGTGYQEARARKEHWLAKAAERDYQVSIGKLLDADQVVAVAADAVANLRTSLEGLPEILGPQLAAEPDEARCRALIAEAIEHALDEAARRFNKLAQVSA